MPKKIFIGESDLLKIKDAMAGNNISHSNSIVENDVPPYEADEFEIGGEGGNNDFFHINKKRQLTESSRADLDIIDSLSFTVDEKYNFDEEEFSHWWDYYDSEDEYLKSCEYYDGDVYDTDGHRIESFCGDRDDIEYYFADNLNIAEKIFNKDAMLRGNTYWITDIQDELLNELNIDINNVDDVNKAAKRLSKPNGASLYILLDGSIIGFHDHAQIQSVCDGMTISRFLAFGNIRCGGGNVVTFQLIKEPTFYQRHAIKNMIEYADEVIVDFAEPNRNDNMYPEVVHSVTYRMPNPERVVNDMVYYFREGIKPFGEGKKRKEIVINESTFEKWFGNSVLKDENGNPIKMYHGTDAQFDAFSKDFIGKTGAFEGYGFNFTPYYSSAAHYNSKNVIEAYLRVENPMTTKTNNITLRTLLEVIKELDKGKDYTETVVAAYETPRYGEKWDERYYRRALPVATKKIYEYNRENDYGDAGIYSEISLNGQADAKDVIRVFESLGYDSVIHYDNYDKIQTVIVFEPNQIKLVTNKTYNNDSDIMSENIEAEVEASEVKLDSFKKKKTLAPKIWNDFDLNPKVRLKLLDIADDFWNFVNLTWVKRKGIYLTGSICNFNWSKHSDIDMHIVVDFSDVDDREDFVQDYFNAKKNEWNNEHSKLNIYGFQVELYVENVNAETESGGIYDLEKNSWVKKPNSDNIKSIGLDKYTIKDKSAELMTMVDDLFDKFKVTDDDAELRAIGNEASDILDDIKKMRKIGLKRGGESDQFNIVYKVLRRTGYIDKLWNLKSSLYDKLNSINEINEGVLLEYLEKEHSASLYDYFKWVNSASEGEKAIDILKNCPDITLKYIGRMSKDYPEFNELYQQSLIDRNVINDPNFVNKFASVFDNDEFLLKGLIRFCGFNDSSKLPTWCLMKFNRIVKNEWCIHFCYDAESIVRDGFKWGTSDVNHLALTGAGEKKSSEGYNFAFPIGEENINTNGYGSFNPETQQIKRNREAVIFQVSGVETFHKGDKQRQVIFWGPNAKNFIPIKFDGRKWCLFGANGQVLNAGTPSSVLDWVLKNLPQYRKQIMFGKNGRSLKEEVVADGNASHNPFKQRWKREREILKDYLVNYGEIMTSKENGKEYKVLYDTMLSTRLGINFCICIQWNSMEMRPGNVVYVRAFDKFTRRRFKPQFDYRGFDNIEGTADDVQQV